MNISTGQYEALLSKVEKTKPLKIGQYEFTLELQPLSSIQIEKAKVELAETEENVRKALAEIRELLKGEPDLHVPNDDYFFSKFLRPCKWNAKYAMELMKRFYQYRAVHSRLCGSLIPSDNREVYLNGLLTPFPKRTKNGCRVLLLEGGKKWNPKVVSLEQIFRGVMVILEAAMVEPSTQVNGIHVILDMDGLSLSHVTYFTPSFASAVLEWVQKCLPARLKGVHVINQPFIFNMVFAIFKPFFMEKLRKRLHFHGTNRRSLLSYIDAEALPSKYGGKLNLLNEPYGENIFQYLMEFEEDFRELGNYGFINKK